MSNIEQKRYLWKDKYLRCFIRDSNQKGHQYYEEKLKRTIQNGSRQQPPRYFNSNLT